MMWSAIRYAGSLVEINPLSAKVSHLYFHTRALEVVARYRDPQLQVHGCK